MISYRSIKTSDISKLTNFNFVGDDIELNGLNLNNRKSNYNSIISYLDSPKQINNIKNNDAIKALITNVECYELLKKQMNLVFFIDENPETVFYDLHDKLYRETQFYRRNKVQPIIGQNCNIADTVILENNTIIGDNVTINHRTVIKEGSVIGNNSIIGCNTIVGSEGFQAVRNNVFNKVDIVRHVGGCIIGDEVFVGDNVTICNSLFEDTMVMGSGTKIDNLVHIAHNCKIGNNCVITAGVIFCGSVIVQDNVWIAPNSTILNKVIIKSNSKIGLGSVVIKNVNEGETVFGNPARKV